MNFGDKKLKLDLALAHCDNKTFYFCFYTFQLLD